MTAVHQLLPVFSYGDAIGNATLRTRDILRRLGYTSEIYAEKVHEKLAAEGHAIHELDIRKLRRDDAIIYRLSIGAASAAIVETLPVRRIIVFHNITPPRYYRQINAVVTYWLERGYADLARLAPLSDLLIADSTFNLKLAQRAGARHCVVIPPPLDFRRLRPRPARPGQPPLLLFVGRLAPNKRHDALLRMLAVLRQRHGIDAHLVLAGSADDTGPYLAALLRLASQLRVNDAVTLTGARRDDVDLGRLFERASVFVTASEHEGLCVPVLEAMAFSVPVVARAAAALPETVGRAGILLDGDDPMLFAAATGRVIYDVPLRRRLVAAGHEQLAAFSAARIEGLLAQELRAINVVP